MINKSVKIGLKTAVNIQDGKEVKLLKVTRLLTKVVFCAAVMLPFFGPKNADALPLGIQLYDGTTTVTVWDGGIGDINTTTGAVTYSGSIGVWTVNVTTGIGVPVLGTASYPILDLNSVNVSTSTGGTLNVAITQTGLGPLPTGSSSLRTSVGGVTSGTVSFNTYYDINDLAFGTGTLAGSLGPYGPGAFSGVTGAPITTGANLYSITANASITQAGAGSTSFNDEVSVPEPSTLLLLGGGLVGIGIWFRRKRLPFPLN